MYKKKYKGLIASLAVGLALFAIAAFSFSSQKSMRESYLAVQGGSMAKAVVHKFSGTEYKEDTKNKYLYTFTAEEDGNTYAASTIHSYYEKETANFYVRYAVDETPEGKQVRLYGGKDDTVEIDGQKYRIAISYENLFFERSRPPETTMSLFLFGISGLVLMYSLFCVIWVVRYKGLERNGILTYAVFTSAYASKTGSRRHLAVEYKYKDENENWIEAVSPYAYSAADAEKLMQLETFKIRYKGKRSMIAENIRNIRL